MRVIDFKELVKLIIPSSHIDDQYKLNRILNVPCDKMRIVKRLGYGARSSVYEVVLGSGQRVAMKYLIQNTERNKGRLKREYDIIGELR